MSWYGAFLANIAQKVVPPRRTPPAGVTASPTFQPANTTSILGVPGYRDHLTDIFTTRQSSDSRALLASLFVHDPDISSTVNSYLTLANTEPQFFVYDLNGQLDRPGQQVLEQLLGALEDRMDYSKGFQRRPSLREICEELRYMILLRGGIAVELVCDKLLMPTELRNVDLASIQWFEQQAGQYKPQQVVSGGNPVVLDIPTFFVSFFRRNPTSIYTLSHFVAAINTIAARQQVTNDLYRIMQKVGYPRLDITVVEEVLRKNAPAECQTDEQKMLTWLNARLQEISSAISNLPAHQAFVHFDSVTTGTATKDGPAQAVDATKIIEVLNEANQAALKTMSTVIGRGESGVNTASAETLIFARNAGELNGPIADILSKAFTLALRLTGSQSRVVCHFPPAELRPQLELEPQLLVKQSRWLQLLSEGLVTDDEFHQELFGRPRPDSVPELSGTKFLAAAPAGAGPNANDVNVNGKDPTGRAITGQNPNAAKGNQVKANALLSAILGVLQEAA